MYQTEPVAVQRTAPATPLSPNSARLHLISLTEPWALEAIERKHQRKEGAKLRREVCLKGLMVLAVVSTYWPMIKTAGSSIFVPREQVSPLCI